MSTHPADPAVEQQITVRVVAKDLVASDVVALQLEDVDGKTLPRWDAGAHVDLIIEGVPVRQYSLSGDPEDRSNWRLGVLRERYGNGASQHIHDELMVGTKVVVRGPRNNFALVPSRRYIFIAGGIGITPLLPMVRAAAAAGSDWRLLYGGRDRASMAFVDELDTFGDRVALCPQDEYGLLDLNALLSEPQTETKVYCCGPESLLTAVEDRCQTWPRGSLHVERFAPKQQAEPVLTGPFDVELARAGITVSVPPELSILSAIQQAGIHALYSCTEGLCGTCETPVLEGVPDHRDSVLDDEEQEANDCMMICVSRSRSPRLVLDL